jgi:hypothetical protein
MLISNVDAAIPTEDLPYTYAWKESTGYYKVYIIEVANVETLKDLCLHPKWEACHRYIDNTHYVIFVTDKMYDYTPGGCNVYTHEMLHAWGYTEQMLHQFFHCENPSKWKELPLM